MRLNTAAVLLLGLCAPAPAAEPQVRFPELFHTLSRRLVTPHIPWARPFAGRKLKVLVIGPRWGQRETVELMQRFDVECAVVPLQSSELVYCEGRHWGHEKVPSIWKDAVLKALNDALAGGHDVIVMGHVPARKLPPDVIETLIRTVRAGTGLVYLWPDHHAHAKLLNVVREGLGEQPKPTPAGQDDAALELGEPLATGGGAFGFLATGTPFEALPGFGIKRRSTDLPKILTVRTVGKGRAICVSYRRGGGLLAPADGVDLHYEYYQAFLIKAILAAAKAEPTALFETFPHEIAGGQLAFSVRNTGGPASLVATLSIRSSERLFRLPTAPVSAPGIHQTAAALAPVHTEARKLELASGSARLAFAIPDLPAGGYFADVVLASEKGTVNWAAARLSVPAVLAISELSVEPSVIDLAAAGGKRLRITAQLSAPAPAEAELRAAVVDAHDRVLSTMAAPLAAGSRAAEIGLPVTGIRSTLLRVRAELAVAGRARSIRSARITATNRGWDAFTFFAWGGVGRDYVGRQRGRVLASLGIDAFRGGSSKAVLDVADVRCAPDLIRLGSPVEERKLTPCYSDPVFRNQMREKIHSAVAQYAPLDAFGFLCGDEWGYMQTNTSHDACWSPTCIARFRADLKARYATVAKLNEQWGTAYGSFGEVVPITIKDAKEQAKSTGNFSHLIDQWVCNFGTFADLFRFCRETLAEADPRRRFGYTTPLWNWWYRGYNWPAIVPQVGFASPYGPWSDRTHSESARSFARPGTILSSHYGSYVTPWLNDADHFRMVPYVIVLNGFSNAFWYTTWGNEGGISPSLDPYPCLAASAEAIREIKSGTGKLLLGAKRQHDGIAIHYSMRSYIFSFLASGPHVPWRINSLVIALEELGLQFDFVSDRQIEQGRLDGYRALILPVSQCIGDAEAARIAAFAEKGGLVVADLRPGIADEHGKVGGRAAMASLFGVRWENPLAPLTKSDVQLSGTYGGKAFTGTLAKELMVDASLRLAGAKAALHAGQTPLLTRHGVGKGAAVCLNFPSSELDGNLHNLLGTILAAHGIRSIAAVQEPVKGFTPGAWIPGFELSRFTDGAATYLGMTRRRLFKPSDDQPGRVTLALGEAANLYDIRAGKYLGQMAELQSDIGPSQAKLYALLPYKVNGLRIELAKAEAAPGGEVAGTVQVLTDGAAPCRHVVHIEAVRPDGERPRYLATNVETREGRAAFRIPLCLNEPRGAWTITCTDAATGVRASTPFRLP